MCIFLIFCSYKSENYGEILAWVGGLTAGFINMTFPSIFYIIHEKDSKIKKSAWVKWVSYFILYFSGIVVLLTLYTLVFNPS